MTLDAARSWALVGDAEERRRRALFLFAWVSGVCSAAGIPMRELAEKLVGPLPPVEAP